MARVSIAPALPVGLGHTVLQGDDGVGVGKLLPHVDQLLLGQLLAGLGLDIALLLLVPPLGGGGVDGDLEVLAGLVARGLACLNDVLQRLFVSLQVGSETALVTQTSR